MKNLTITLPDDIVSRLRVAAAKDNKSMSRFTAELIENRLGRTRSPREAMERFLAGPKWNLSDENGRLPTRTEIYDDHLLYRHERDPLHLRSSTASEAKSVSDMAEQDSASPAADDQPAGDQRVLPRRAS
jgi:plasmid stability protein